MERLVFDYSKLKGRITEKLGSQKAFATRLCVAEPTLTSKLSCRTYFSQAEILKSCKILEIPEEEIFAYFFTQRVQKVEQ